MASNNSNKSKSAHRIESSSRITKKGSNTTKNVDPKDKLKNFIKNLLVEKQEKLKQEKSKQVKSKQEENGDQPVICSSVKVDYRSTVKSLVEFLSTITEKQRKDIMDIGFGSLLRLNIHKQVDRRFYGHLVDMYQSMIIRLKDGNTIHAGATFFYETLGLPCRGEVVYGHNGKICEGLIINKDDVPISRQRVFLRTLAIELGMEKVPDGLYINLNTMRTEMEKLSGGGPAFKKLFVLFAFTSFLASNKEKSAILDIIDALVDVDRIHCYDWCSYIASNVDLNIDKLKSDVKGEKSKGNKRYDYTSGGCIFALMIGYFHNVLLGEELSSEIPYIHYWDDNKLRDRIDLEMRHLGVAAVKIDKKKDRIINLQPLSINPPNVERIEEHVNDNLQLTPYEGCAYKKRKMDDFLKNSKPSGNDANVVLMGVVQDFKLFFENIAQRLESVKGNVGKMKGAEHDAYDTCITSIENVLSNGGKIMTRCRRKLDEVVGGGAKRKKVVNVRKEVKKGEGIQQKEGDGDNVDGDDLDVLATVAGKIVNDAHQSALQPISDQSSLPIDPQNNPKTKQNEPQNIQSNRQNEPQSIQTNQSSEVEKQTKKTNNLSPETSNESNK